MADLLRVGYLPRVWLRRRCVNCGVVRHRQQLAQSRRAAKLRVTALLRAERVEFRGSRWTKSWIAAVRNCDELGEQGRRVVTQLLDEIIHLQVQIDQAEARLKQFTADDPFVAALRAMNGIGVTMSVTLRAELGTMSCFRSGKRRRGSAA